MRSPLTRPPSNERASLMRSRSSSSRRSRMSTTGASAVCVLVIPYFPSQHGLSVEAQWNHWPMAISRADTSTFARAENGDAPALICSFGGAQAR